MRLGKRSRLSAVMWELIYKIEGGEGQIRPAVKYKVSLPIGDERYAVL